MAQGDELRGALGGQNTGHLGHAQHIALGGGMAGDGVQHRPGDLDLTLGHGQTAGGRFGRDIHHDGVALGVKMIEFGFHRDLQIKTDGEARRGSEQEDRDGLSLLHRGRAGGEIHQAVASHQGGEHA